MRPGVFEEPPCETLPLDITEAYFFADFYQDLYRFRTAQTICGRCAVQEACLAEAIATPGDHYGIRGGEAHSSIRRLRVQYNQTERSAEALARETIARNRHRPGVEALRKTDFQPSIPVRDGSTGPAERRRLAG